MIRTGMVLWNTPKQFSQHDESLSVIEMAEWSSMPTPDIGTADRGERQSEDAKSPAGRRCDEARITCCGVSLVRPGRVKRIDTIPL
ncbi:hypothetical protein ACDH70_15610 [Xanthomonas axonopodis pv. poinsettiicola]|uniref:hypothetical protein n=1 Tax=Xanthomonas TaxID=338 RepID=UPI001E47461A|nr:hypothetical protein [Xanthomonas codiaei]MCC8538508.1 hypothetical protein [Xanthomonas codiaei]